MGTRDELADSCGVVDYRTLVTDNKSLSEIFDMMQKQSGHRLSKISYFILKISNVMLMNDSGCKWVMKEKESRPLEIESSFDRVGIDESVNEVLKHNSALEEIESKAAIILQRRYIWLKEFVEKVELHYDVLDKFYEEISEFANRELENEGSQVKASLLLHLQFFFTFIEIDFWCCQCHCSWHLYTKSFTWRKRNMRMH